MPGFSPQKGLYKLRLNKFRFAYELTDQSIIISTIIESDLFQRETNALQLSTLMNQSLPQIIYDLFEIDVIHSTNNITENKRESFITISPKDDHSETGGADDSDHDRLNIKEIHQELLNELRMEFDHVEMRWLGALEPGTQSPI